VQQEQNPATSAALMNLAAHKPSQAPAEIAAFLRCPMRLLLSILLLAAAGCSSCHDGRNVLYGYSSNVYRPCSGKCHRPVNPKPCECSMACPCYASHPVVAR
jgi:hypothetical protein